MRLEEVIEFENGSMQLQLMILIFIKLQNSVIFTFKDDIKKDIHCTT